MKKICFLISFLYILGNVLGQKKGVTEHGDPVILYDDGTWIYENMANTLSEEIPVNAEIFTKKTNSGFQIKSEKVNMSFWIDPKKWQFKKAEAGGEGEYELQSKAGDLFCVIITEKIEIPLETLQNIALENGKKVAPDIKVIKREYRMVNGLKVLLMQMDGTIQGIKFSYFGYYYSNNSGTVQFITYTSQNMLEAKMADAVELLNGLAVTK